MTKETARAITQLVPKYDQMMIMGSSIKNAIAHLKLYKLNDEEIKLIITACVVQGLNYTEPTGMYYEHECKRQEILNSIKY